jgi:biotin carboxyl carrier protein
MVMTVRSGRRSQLHEVSPDSMGESGTFGFRLLVSPAAGKLRHLPPAQFHGGEEWVSPGQPVAVVEQGSVSVEVRSPIEARVAGILVRDGEPVAPGQPLVWLDDSGLRHTAERPRREAT